MAVSATNHRIHADEAANPCSLQERIRGAALQPIRSQAV